MGGGSWPSAPALPRDYWTPETIGAIRVAPRLAWVAPVLVTVTLLALYATTTCRSVFWYDSAEFVTAATVWGVPHPPGYPGYVLLAHLVTLLPFPPALLVNLFSALTMACAMGLLVRIQQQLGTRPLYAAMSALLVGTSDLIWANSTVAEVYGPGLCCALGILTLLLSAVRSRRIGLVWLACWLAGFGLGVHYFLATMGLGFAWLLLQFTRRVRVGFGDYVVATALFSFGLTVFVLLPLRAAQGAALNFGDPQNWSQFLWVITGGTYGQFFHPVTLERATWFLWLLWDTWTPAGLVVAIAGAAVLGRLVRRAEWAAVLLAILGNFACFLPYWVHDPEVFLMPGVVLLGTLVGAGAEWLHLQLGQLALGSVTLSYLVSALLSGVVTYRSVRSYPYQDLSHFRAADEYGQMLTTQLPQGAFIANFTTPPEWQYDAVFTYYQLVLGMRPDVTKVQLPDADLLIQMVDAQLPVFVYTPTAGVLESPFVLTPERDLLRLGLDDAALAALRSAVPTPPSLPDVVFGEAAASAERKTDAAATEPIAEPAPSVTHAF